MMKSVSSFLCKTLLAALFCALIFILTGCSVNQMGETSLEGDVRHQRALRVNNEQMMADIDKFLLLDEPSKLSERRIP
jgi:hypothetical protein